MATIRHPNEMGYTGGRKKLCSHLPSLPHSILANFDAIQPGCGLRACCFPLGRNVSSHRTQAAPPYLEGQALLLAVARAGGMVYSQTTVFLWLSVSHANPKPLPPRLVGFGDWGSGSQAVFVRQYGDGSNWDRDPFVEKGLCAASQEGFPSPMNGFHGKGRVAICPRKQGQF